MKSIALCVASALSLLPTSAPLPRVSSLPFPTRQISNARRRWQWLKWAAWYPFDWLLYEDAYAQIVESSGLIGFSITVEFGMPPPTYRWAYRMLESLGANGLREIRDEADW